ncbi:MAG: DUF6338 family protein [Alphaproteobacteria bacterium]
MPDLSKIFYIFIYLIPGFVAREMFLARYPVRKKSTVELIIWSIIYSFVILIALCIISEIFDDPRLNYFNRDTSSLGVKSYLLILVGGVILGVMLILQREIRFWIDKKIPDPFQEKPFFDLRFRLWMGIRSVLRIPPDPGAVWPMVNKQEQGSFAAVFLNDGSIYLGWIGQFTYDPNASEQDFLLQDAKKIDENFNEIYKVEGIGVYLNTKNVKRIEYYDPF